MISVRLQKLIDALEHAGCNVKKTGSKTYKSQCPAHEDNNPSLGITENSDGKISIKCFAGCEGSDILKKLGLDFEILYPDSGDGSSSASKNRRIVATYPYTDENGELLFEAVRFHPKDFRQRQPDVGGGWKYNLKGVRRVIYNLPVVLEAADQGKPVFLVEGEKDAEALAKRDLVATTCPMGAGKWKSEYNEFFKGVELIVIPDNDKPGKEHAARVSGELIGTAKTVRILQLPALEEKEDVSDWLMKGGTRDELLDLAFNTDPVGSENEASALLNIELQIDETDPRNLKDLFFEDNYKIYSRDEEERVIADFNIDIQSIVKDDREGQIFYVKIREIDRGRPRISDTIEIKPEYLDDLRSFYKAIRPYSMGEIISYRKNRTKPLTIFKWLLQNFDKPIVRRPDHVGFTKGPENRPFWIFGNAVVCPPWKGSEGKIVEPNEAGEYIINNKLGFTLPLYENEMEKEQLAPFINLETEGAGEFLGEVKEKLIELIGGGDPASGAQNYGKILLAYVIYHLYERQLYYANDINGHTVILYVFGDKGTGKTTYFNTILRAFFGLHKTKDIKGNTVSIPGLENAMGMYSQMPVCYDEFNPEASDISFQAINGYYHRSSRHVSDRDRHNRNKFTPIRSSLTIMSNFRINLDMDQADATESRTIYFQYKKEYRSTDYSLLEWFEDNLNQLSRVTSYLLLNQTDKKRKEVKQKAIEYFSKMKTALDEETAKHPRKYAVEHRLTDNYTRLLAAYELVFGEDPAFRGWIRQELLDRFAASKINQKEHALLNQLIFLASSGRIKESWHYNYNNNQKELYVDLNQCYGSYEEYKRDRAFSRNQVKEILKDYFEDCGGFQTGTVRWYGKYLDRGNNLVNVNKPQHSYILTYNQINGQNLLSELFPPKDEHREKLRRLDPDNSDDSQQGDFELENEAPF